MYNLIEYSNNYSDISGSLWHFKRDETDEDFDANHIPNNSSSFKYKSNFISFINQAVPLKYLSNFWRSLEMPLINCKIELSLKWDKNYILFSKDGNSAFEITDTKCYVPIVTLGFTRPIYWNQYKVIPNKTYRANEYIRELLDSSYQGVKRLFVLVYGNANGITADSHRKYFLLK